MIGGLRAHDFWGDGSLYILDTPGVSNLVFSEKPVFPDNNGQHSIGHISALARTTETDFIFMGGDICHFPGSFRPTADIPMPDPLPEASLDQGRPRPCPALAFTCCHPAGPVQGRLQPFYTASDYERTIYADPPLANATVRHLMDFDASPNILVAIGHDPAVPIRLPTLDMNGVHNENLNDWRVRGFKDAIHWDFLNELPQDERPGRPMLANGYECEGEAYQLDKAEMVLVKKWDVL